MTATETMPRQFSGAKLKALRTALEWSETKLAAEASCTAQAIKDLEAGKYAPGGELLGRLADALGLERIDDLFKRTQ